MYSIIWNTFLAERIPGFLNRPRLLSWLNALLAPVKQLHSLFLLFKLNTDREVQITGQVRILRYWLNELWDYTDRRFEVLDYENVEPILIWGEAFNNPIYLPAYMSSSDYDFIVKAPCEAFPQRVQIRSFLDKFKLAGKRYTLLWVGDCPAISIFEDE